MKNANIFTVINDYLSEYSEITEINWASEYVPNDTAIIEFAGTKLKCSVSVQPEEHCFLFSVL